MFQLYDFDQRDGADTKAGTGTAPLLIIAVFVAVFFAGLILVSSVSPLPPF